MKVKEKPHDPGWDQRLKMRYNRARLNKRIIHRFKRSINRKARSEADSLPARQPRNAHPSLSRTGCFLFIPLCPQCQRLQGGLNHDLSEKYSS